jgi:peptide/nickel transport system permease protein
MRGSIHGSATVEKAMSMKYQSSHWIADTFRRLRRSPNAMIGLFLFACFLLMVLLAPWIAPYDAVEMQIPDRLQAPSPAHLFGTDDFGRDIFSRVVWGSRLAIRLGILSVLIGAGGGILLGLIAGYYGGQIDNILSRLLEIVMALPEMLFAITIIAILGPSLDNLVVALGLFGWPGFMRMTRGSVLSAKQNDYVEAARAIGVPSRWVMLRHILPNVAAPVIILSASRFGGALLAGSGLSFIGLGVPIPQPEWGAIMATGREYMASAWWITVFPGVMIALVVLGINLLADGLRDALDPRLKQ